MRREGLGLAPALLLAGACAAPGPPPPPEPAIVDVGVHRLSFIVPEGWLHFDHGREQRFERGTLRMALADLGPADGAGFVAVVDEARALWQDGRAEDARALLSRLPPWPPLPDDAEQDGFREAWDLVARAGEGASPNQLDEAYYVVRATVSSLPLLDIEVLADAALGELGHDQRRSVAERSPVDVDGREGLWVDTWDRLSHDYPKRFLFVVSDGHLLVLHTELGALAPMEKPLALLAASLRFR